MKSKDLQILKKLKNGHSEAYKELFDLYYMPLCIYALKYCDSFQLAEDIVQDLFVQVWDKKLFMKFEGAISPYLFKSVKNNTLQVVKKKSKYLFEDIEDQVNKLMTEEKVDAESVEKEKQKLYSEVEALPEKSKKVFKAIVLEGMKYKEVAEHMGVSVNTIKTQYSRALKQLRNSLDTIILILLA